MAYLVTGGTGFIGSYTVRDLLNAGKEVVCLQRSGITPVFRQVVGEDKIDKVKIVQGDVSDALLLFNLIREHGIDLIVHIGYVLQPVSEQQPAYALRVNCIGMSNILEAVRLFGLKRLVWTSSGTAFGRIREIYKEPLGDDDAIFMPDLFYGATKVLNEFMARLYFEKFGTDSIGFRVPATYGVGKNGRGLSLSGWLREAALSIPVTIHDPDFVTGCLYVEDASALIVKACDVPTTKTRVFNVEEGEYSNRQIAEIIRKINPQAQVTLVEGKSSESHRVETSGRDTTGVRTELGWKPRYSLEDGIRKAFNIWRQQAGLT